MICSDYRRPMASSLLCAALMAFPASASIPEAVKLAIFDFEFEDASAGDSPPARRRRRTRYTWRTSRVQCASCSSNRAAIT